MSEEAQVEERDPDMTIIHTHKWFAGIVFILISMGGFVASRYLELETPQQAHILGIFIVGLIGLVLLFYRSGVTLDREEKVVTKWRSILGFRMVSEEIDLRERSVVLLRASTEQREAGETMEDFRLYSVGVEGGDGDAYIHLDSVEDSYREGQQLSERFAKFLWVPIIDTTSGERVEREPESIDESLRERCMRTGEYPKEMPEAIDAVSVARGEGEVAFTIPGRVGFFRGLGHVFYVAFAGGGTGGAAWLFLNETHEFLRPVWLGITVISGLLLGWALLRIVKDLTFKEVVTIRPTLLELRARWLLWSSTEEMPLEDLEEILVNTERGERLREFEGLRARSDDDVLDFGEYLEVEERTWVREAMTHIIATQ